APKSSTSDNATCAIINARPHEPRTYVADRSACSPIRLRIADHAGRRLMARPVIIATTAVTARTRQSGVTASASGAFAAPHNTAPAALLVHHANGRANAAPSADRTRLSTTSC